MTFRVTFPTTVLALALLSAACEGPGRGPVVIEESRVRPEPAESADPDATGMERFGFEQRPAPPPSVRPPAGSTAAVPGDGGDIAMAEAPRLRWETPAGWSEAGDNPMRVVTFQAAPRTECYVSALPGDGGGLAGNLNRWRRQMGAEPMTPGELEALPTVDMLGESVPLLDVSGTFTSMQGASSPGFRMLGAVRLLPGRSVFVKMTGPDGEVAAQREAFVALCASLRLEDGA